MKKYEFPEKINKINNTIFRKNIHKNKIIKDIKTNKSKIEIKKSKIKTKIYNI